MKVLVMQREDSQLSAYFTSTVKSLFTRFNVPAASFALLVQKEPQSASPAFTSPGPTHPECREQQTQQFTFSSKMLQEIQLIICSYWMEIFN